MNDSVPTQPVDLPDIDPWGIPGVFGSELARQVEPALDIVHKLKSTRAISRSEIGELMQALQGMRRMALSTQQISRLAAGRLRQSHERLDLAQVWRDVVAENEDRYFRLGVEVESHLQRIEVVTDPGLLVSLCEAAVDWAILHGGRVQAWLKMMHWPEHALLTIRSRPHLRGQDPVAPAAESVEWVYLRRLAHATGVAIRREVLPDYVEVTLQFPRTVKQLEGLTAMEVDGGSDLLDSRPVAGHRVLLVSTDQGVAWEVGVACRQMRLVVDVVPDCRAAVRFCELDMPDLIILDEQVRDEVFEDLRADILRHNIQAPCVEIVADPNVIELGGWDDTAISRLSRSDLRSRLQTVLAMELARVV